MAQISRILFIFLVVLLIFQLLMVDDVEGRRRKRKGRGRRKRRKNKRRLENRKKADIHDRCGYDESLFQTNIINGKPAKQTPWVAAYYIYYENSGTQYGFCGGTLISSTKVLTAAHCLTPSRSYGDVKYLRVVIGTNKLSKLSKGSFEATTTDYKVHPNYAIQPTYIENDIAYITIPPVQSTLGILPVCLPPLSPIEDYAGTKAQAIGFGLTDTSGTRESDILMLVGLNVMQQSNCTSEWNQRGVRIFNHHLCAIDDNKSICSGDSGGALYIVINKLTYVIGISSFTPRGCVGISVFTRVTEFVPWLAKEFGTFNEN